MMYFFMRHLKVDGFSAFFGTTVFLFGSTFGGAFYNMNSLKIMCWFPLVLMMTDMIIEKRKPMYIAILIFAITQILLAGYLQYAIYACVFAALYFLIRLAGSLKHDRRILGSFSAVSFSFVAAGLLTLPQHLLTYELYMRSNRVGLGEGFSYLGSFSPLAGICFFIPNLDVIFNGKLYMGAISVFFFILGTIVLWKRKERVFIWLAGTALLLALGMFSPLYVSLVKFFKFYAFRVPMKFLLFLGFFFSVITAYGVNAIMESGFALEKWIKTSSRWFIALAAFSVLIFSGMAFLLRTFHDKVFLLGSLAIKNFVYNKPGHPYSLEHYTQKLEGFLNSAKNVLDVTGPNFLVPLAVIAVSACLIYLFRKRRITKLAFLTLALLFVVVDLRTYKLDPSFGDARDYDSYANFFKKSEITEFLEKNKGDYRIFNFSNNKSLLPLSANYNMIFNIDSANAYSPLVLRDYYDFFGKMGGIDDSSGATMASKEYLYDHLRQLGMMNVKYVLSDEKLDGAGLNEVYRDSRVAVYENAFFMPRFWLVDNAKIIEDREKLFNAVQRPDFSPASIAYIEGGPGGYLGHPGKGADKDSIKVMSEGPERLVLDVNCSKDMLMVLSQVHYPGWKALVDGKEEAELIRINYLISGIPLKKGKHEVKIYYKPDPLRVLSKLVNKRSARRF
jgi:hypothetical protein